MRTTLNIDDPVLRELKRVQKREGKTLGQLVSELLTFALAQRAQGAPRKRQFRWVAKPMNAKLDVDDREAIWEVLCREDPLA